jgi:hypothetical protein
MASGLIHLSGAWNYDPARSRQRRRWGGRPETVRAPAWRVGPVQARDARVQAPDVERARRAAVSRSPDVHCAVAVTEPARAGGPEPEPSGVDLELAAAAQRASAPVEARSPAVRDAGAELAPAAVEPRD